MLFAADWVSNFTMERKKLLQNAGQTFDDFFILKLFSVVMEMINGHKIIDAATNGSLAKEGASKERTTRLSTIRSQRLRKPPVNDAVIL